MFRAETSHPSDWSTKTAILFPTFLEMIWSATFTRIRLRATHEPRDHLRASDISVVRAGVGITASYMTGDRENAGLWDRIAVRHWPSYTESDIQFLSGAENGTRQSGRASKAAAREAGQIWTKLNTERRQGLAQRSKSRANQKDRDRDRGQHEGIEYKTEIFRMLLCRLPFLFGLWRWNFERQRRVIITPH